MRRSLSGKGITSRRAGSTASSLLRRIWISGGWSFDTSSKTERIAGRARRAGQTQRHHRSSADQRGAAPRATRAAAHARSDPSPRQNQPNSGLYAHGQRERRDDYSCRRSTFGEQARDRKSQDTEARRGPRRAAAADESRGFARSHRVHRSGAAILEHFLSAEHHLGEGKKPRARALA